MTEKDAVFAKIQSMPLEALAADVQLDLAVRLPAGETAGIKEITEILDLLVLIPETIRKHFADGVQLMDGLRILMDKDARRAIVAAGSGLQNLPAEIKDLSAEELETIFAGYTARIIMEFKELFNELSKGEAN